MNQAPQPNTVPPQVQYQPFQPGVTVLYTSAGAPVPVLNVNQENKFEKYKARPAKILGVLQIVCGVIIIICQIGAIAVRAIGFEGSVGFWASIIFILAGAFGIRSSKSKSKCTVIATMVLSIIGAIFTSGVISQGAIGAALTQDCDYIHGRYQCGHHVSASARSAVFFCSVMVIFGILEAIVAIVAAAYCCQGCCCHQKQRVVISQGTPMTQGGMQMTAVHYQHTPAFLPALTSPMPSTSLPPGNEEPPAYKEKV